MATSKNFCSRSDGLDNLGKSGKEWGDVYAKNLHITETVDLPADFVNDVLAKKLSPIIVVTTLTGSTVTATKGTTTVKGAENGSTGKFTIEVPSLGDWIVTATKSSGVSFTNSKTVTVAEIKEYDVEVPHGVRYGYRIKKSESDPYGRVEYLYDAVGFTPAKMNFTSGTFDYGDWGDVWFVTKNKPCMLKYDGTVDYYLNPNNYAYKENGASSDVTNTGYSGNAMASFPLCWVYRYEDDNYQYEIVSNIKYDDNYKAYAHTKSDGTIADYFYWGLFSGSDGSSSAKMRSLSGRTPMKSNTATVEVTASKLNGSGWYTHTWSQKELIRTLLTLMGKSTNSQAIYGNGNCRSASSDSVLSTGSLISKGQFWGTSANSTSQVKAFHVERIWGDQWDRLAGIIYNDNQMYIKMTPEGQGYRINDMVGYTNTGISISGSSGGYISSTVCTEYGMIPNTVSGSSTTYFADGCWYASGLCYGLTGASAAHSSGFGGSAALCVDYGPSNSNWNYGACLSFI